MMSKVLLLDTNLSSLPIYESLVQKGFDVFVAGVNPNDFLAKMVPNYFEIDYSNLEKVKEIVVNNNLDFIVPGCNDLSYKICSLLNSDNKFFGIDSFEQTETINNKKLFRLMAERIKLSVPKNYHAENLNWDDYPIIVKPVDAYSGRGVTIIHQSNDRTLKTAVKNAQSFSRSGDYLIQEFVDGQLYSHSAFIKNGKISIDFIVEEFGSANPFVVDTSRVVYDFPVVMLKLIQGEIAEMARALNLSDGLVHTQFIKRGQKFFIIEITRRCPGDLYSQLIEMATGFKYAAAYAMHFVKEKVNYDVNLDEKYIMRHTISEKDAFIFNGIKFLSPLLIEKYYPLSLAGTLIEGSPFGRIGLLFAKTTLLQELLSLINITVERHLYTTN